MISYRYMVSVRPKPFLKWAGGKSRLSSKIKSLFPTNDMFNKYFEPFLGSAAVYFEISPQEGRLNDLNKHLINTYIDIRDHVQQLIKELKIIDEEYHSCSSITEKEKYYYKTREAYNQDNKKSIKRSAQFVFLNKAGFNGMYRENSSGRYNIPFGKNEKCLICDEDNLLAVSRDLKNIELTIGDYKDAVFDAKPGDLVYFDPPYFPISKTANFTTYQKGGFGHREQEELYDIAMKLVKKGCYVFISNSYCEESRTLYKDMTIHKVKVKRIINSKSSRRNEIVTEIVATNYKGSVNE